MPRGPAWLYALPPTPEITGRRRRALEVQAAAHRVGDPDHDPRRCPDCRPSLLEVRGRVEALTPSPVAVQVDRVELARPRFLVGDDGRIRVGEIELSQSESAELRIAIELQRRPKPWRDLEAWIDATFRGAWPVRVRPAGVRSELEGLAVRTDPRRALVRLGRFQVAHLVAQRSRPWWSGLVADYSPGPLSVSAEHPDPTTIATARRVAIRDRDAQAAPLAG